MILLIDKPKGITSHDVVDEIRRITGERKVGHAGTLDPNATGLLIVGVGRQSTKKLGSLTKDTTKTYEAEIILGEERDTDDVKGNIRNSKFKSRNNIQITKPQISKMLSSYIGQQEQIPPEFSAIKLRGKKAYELARKGKSVKLNARNIVIHSIKLLSFKYPKLNIVVKVSSGTFIRALARDIGRSLGTGAYLNELRRTNIGKFPVKNAMKLSELRPDNWQKNAIV